MGVRKLKRFLEQNDVETDFYEFSESTLTADDAAEQLEVEPERIVKSLIFMDENSNPLLAIVPGEERADEDKLSKIHGEDIRMAKAREVEDFTGYKIGEVPPVSLGLPTFADSEVIEFETVIAGGGSTHTLVELRVEDILNLTDATVVDIT